MCALCDHIPTSDIFRHCVAGDDSVLMSSENKSTSPNALMPDKPDPNVNLPLHRCVFDGDAARLAALLDSKQFVVDHQDQYGNTALHIAVMRGGQIADRCVPLLLAAGAQCSILNKEGQPDTCLWSWPLLVCCCCVGHLPQQRTCDMMLFIRLCLLFSSGRMDRACRGDQHG